MPRTILNAYAIIVNQKLICYEFNVRLILVLLTYFYNRVYVSALTRSYPSV